MDVTENNSDDIVHQGDIKINQTDTGVHQLYAKVFTNRHYTALNRHQSDTGLHQPGSISIN